MALVCLVRFTDTGGCNAYNSEVLHTLSVQGSEARTADYERPYKPLDKLLQPARAA